MNLLNCNLQNLSNHKTLVPRDQYPDLLAQLDQWGLIQKDGVNQLFCVYKCEDFVKAMHFAQAITELAEQVDHHPAILIEWGKLSISWWTHSLGGLHINDFIMAARTQQLYTAQ